MTHGLLSRIERRLELFYESLGDRGIMFILYAFSVVVNSLLTWTIKLPSIYPDEFSPAGIAAFYSGRDWTGLLSQTGSTGYIQALFYAPLFTVFKNPYALYKSMLIINAMLISLVPLIIYHLAAKLGVQRVRYKLLAAVCCGMYVSYIADSKYIWNETITSLLCWVMVLCFFTAWDNKNDSKTGNKIDSRITMSVLLGFLCAFAYAANTRLLALAVALIITVILTQLVFKEKIVNIPVFIGSIAASFTAEHFLRLALENSLWKASADFSHLPDVGGNFFEVFFAQIYVFFTSSLGLGAIAAAISLVMIYTCISEGVQKRDDASENGTQTLPKYSPELTMFSLFQLVAVLCTAVYSALLSASGASREVVFGRFSDNLAPLSLFLMLMFVLVYGKKGLELKHIMYGVGIYAYSCLCFALVGYSSVNAEPSAFSAPVMGILPVTLGKGSMYGYLGMTFIIMSSCVFTLFALLLVFISCSRKQLHSAFVSAAVFTVTVLAAGYFGTVYLPEESVQNDEQNEPYLQVFEFLYNDPQSPPIIVYEENDEEITLAAKIQFLAPETRVSILEKGEKIPESCLLIAKNGTRVPFEGGSYDNVGKTDLYSVYAFGESARDFIRYSAANEREP